ncbi:MAG TPA: nitrous oxide reductase family maturation protein NosD [Candidatus Desulfobacillus denitrificans]|nr:nitrous oxide reductase family maturation protein NosD [Candidatus Desulfobacillus denitrificans]HNT61319.1 nitrous oxide reductase family maturation protein NosD [Candidatus Desulfobacillus denitrificans]
MLRRLTFLLATLLGMAQAAPPLQPLIDATPAGGTLRPAPGIYAGPAVIAKPITLDGGGKATLAGNGRGTVLTLATSGATLRGLRLTGSGDSHDGIDAGLLVAGDDNLVEHNAIDDVLFGIHLRQGNRNRIRANRVTGRAAPRGARGDGLRLWNSRHNRIEGNAFRTVRDLTFANSPDNLILRNTLADGRYGMQFVFSPRARVEGNRLADTDTGIAVLYSPDLVLRGNTIAHALDGGGAGLSLKDSGGALVENNEILHCAAGLSANAPLNAETALTVRGNRFAHNIVGMYFYGEQGGHKIVDNRFENNLTQVAVSAAGVGAANDWTGNLWSDYQGFDRDGDGIGDTPHEVWLYSDRIWMETPRAKFFANSPALELLDFLEKLAPFAAPSLILRDPAPRMAK